MQMTNPHTPVGNNADDAGRRNRLSAALVCLPILFVLFFGLAAGRLQADVTLFVAPEKTGSGSGQTAAVTLENNRVNHNTLDRVVYESWPNGADPQRYPDAEYKNLFDLTRLVHRR